jgi:hypothetical protein
MKSYKTRVAAACLTAVLCVPAFASVDRSRENPRRDIVTKLRRLIHDIEKSIGITIQEDAPLPPRP